MSKIRKMVAGMVPEYSVFPLILAAFFNLAVYEGARMIAGNWYHYNIESSLDKMIPFCPPAVAVYLGSYVFWIVNYIIIARQRKLEVCQFFAGDLISRMICLVFFLLFPTTNHRPVVAPDGFWNLLMCFLYSVDAADNLFPSIHCLVSWFCYIGIRNKREIPRWYQTFSCVTALMICASTLLTKQHVLVDVAGGILLAELCFYIGKRSAVWKTYEKFSDRISSIFRGRGEI